MSYFREKAWPQYGQLNRFPSPDPPVAAVAAAAVLLLLTLVLLLLLLLLPLVPVDGGVGISCCCSLPEFLGGRPTFLGLATFAPGVATTRALAVAGALAGLALLPLVVLAIVVLRRGSKKRTSELSARTKR